MGLKYYIAVALYGLLLGGVWLAIRKHYRLYHPVVRFLIISNIVILGFYLIPQDFMGYFLMMTAASLFVFLAGSLRVFRSWADLNTWECFAALLLTIAPFPISYCWCTLLAQIARQLPRAVPPSHLIMPG